MTQAIRTTRVRGGFAASLPQTRTTRVRGAGGVAVAIRTTRVRGALKGALVSAGIDLVSEPFQPLSVSGFVLPGATPPDSWTVRQLTGPIVLAGTVNGATFNYAAPATLTGTALTFQVNATYAGLPDATDTVTHTVKPHGRWAYAANLSLVAVNDEPAVTGGTGGDLSALGAAPLGSRDLGV